MSAVILPTAVFLSFLFSVAMLVKNVVYEKEQRLKEVLSLPYCLLLHSDLQIVT